MNCASRKLLINAGYPWLRMKVCVQIATRVHFLNDSDSPALGRPRVVLDSSTTFCQRVGLHSLSHWPLPRLQDQTFKGSLAWHYRLSIDLLAFVAYFDVYEMSPAIVVYDGFYFFWWLEYHQINRSRWSKREWLKTHPVLSVPLTPATLADGLRWLTFRKCNIHVLACRSCGTVRPCTPPCTPAAPTGCSPGCPATGWS